MADLNRIKQNVAKMASMNAPEQDIDGYIASEGVTVKDVRDYNISPKSFLQKTGDVAIKAITPIWKSEDIQRDPITSAISTLIPMQQMTMGLPRADLPSINSFRRTGAEEVSAQTSPLAIIGNLALATGVAKSLIPKTNPLKYVSKAEKMTTELLQPSKGDLASYIERGKTLPAVEEATKTIKSSKNYTELRNNIDNAIKGIMDERNVILKENNRSIGDYTKPLKNYINELKLKGQATPAEIQQMQDVLDRELEFANKNKLDRLSGQNRKEYLQDLTDTLLQKTEHGDIIDTQPARNRALDKLRFGLKQEVEGGNYKVKELNSRYGGLREARKLIAGQDALARKAVPENILQKVVRIVTRPGDIPGAIMQGALDRQNSLVGKTKKIESLMKKAQSSSR